MAGNKEEERLLKAFSVLSKHNDLINVVPKRRGITPTFPGMDVDKNYRASDEILGAFGFDDFVRTSNGEMKRRPLPHLFDPEKGATIRGVLSDWYPELMQTVLRMVKPHRQSYVKESRLGWPYLTITENKTQLIREAAVRILGGDHAYLNKSYTLINVRIQPESRSKKRQFYFVDGDGKFTYETVDETDRYIEKWDLYSGRTRTIFLLNIGNNINQCLDSAIHDVFLRHPSCHHVMPQLTNWVINDYYEAWDTKNFDRYCGVAIEMRAELIGGLYKQLHDCMYNAPFMVPTSDRRVILLVQVDRSIALVQMPSGISSVTAAGKELEIIYYAKFFFENGYASTKTEAIRLAMNGGVRGVLEIKNYGDDNFVHGDKAAIKAAFQMFSQYMAMEIEDPPRFLGYEYVHNVGFRLSKASYIKNLWLNERAPFSTFRQFPNLGFMKRREVYRQQGVPDIVTDVYPFEDKLLERYGIPISLVAKRASAEATFAASRPDFINEKVLLGKEYALTDDEKMRMTDTYDFLSLNETTAIMKALLGKEASGWVHI